MTTHIYKQYDPQTRKLTTLRPSTVGGTTEDESSTILHFSYTQPDYLETHNPYIIFDVKNDQGENVFFYKGSPTVFDGVTFAIPYSVVHAVQGNYLKFVLAFSALDETLDRVEFEQSALDVLQIPHSHTDALLVRMGIPTTLPQNAGPNEWIEYIKKYAVFNPVEYDEVNSEIVFSSYDGVTSTVNLNRSKPQFATFAIPSRVEGVPSEWIQEGGKWYYTISGPSFFDESKTVTMYWNERTDHYASIAGLTLVGLNGTSAIIRADQDPAEVWSAGQIVYLDFISTYTTDVTDLIERVGDEE